MGPIIAFSSFALAAFSAPLAVISLGTGEVALDWVLPERVVYAGELLSIDLEISLPETWLAPLEGHLIQLFPQPLDLPLQVSAFEALGGGRLIPVEVASEAGSQSIVVDGAISRAAGPVLSATTDGTTIATFTLRRWFTAPRAGAIELSETAARYAYASEFREDFVQGRVPVDRQTGSAVGNSSVLEVAALPEGGRPFEFAGAVGAFELSTSASATAAEAGDSVSLFVRIAAQEGQPVPNVEARDLRLEESQAFVEQSRSVTREGSGLLVEISFEARALGFHPLPAASLTIFDPTLDPPAYRVAAETGPGVQIRRASDAGPNAGPNAGPTVGPAEDPIPIEDEPQPIPYWTIGTFGFIFACAVASVIRRRIL